MAKFTFISESRIFFGRSLFFILIFINELLTIISVKRCDLHKFPVMSRPNKTSVLTLISVIIMISSSEIYLHERNLLLAEEKSVFFGHNITLSPKELQVNEILMRKKREELVQGHKNSSDFLPGVHFFEAKERIDRSEVFRVIRRVPKAASLHTHVLAAGSADFLVKNVSYRDNLYGCWWNGVFKMKFFGGSVQDDRCSWTSIKELRAQKGEFFDGWLHQQLVLTGEHYSDVESIWKKFKKTFNAVYDMLCYRPVFEDYITQVLQELYDDNVFYTELKGTIMPLYDLEGTVYSKQQFCAIFIDVVDRFKRSHPGFLGVRYINSVYRGLDQAVLDTSLKETIELKRAFPNFIAGFDLVGFEEEGKTLLDYVPVLLEAQEQLRFFFHAGETLWFGHTDLNLADAILLNSFRIGHGLALTKHPKLLQLGKERNIPIEVCPISNQVLMVNQDPRNHPAATLMAQDYPVVVGNDDPTIWNATGLSYDWYVVFMAMTPEESGLEVLKQLAINSIVYSAMDEEEKKGALGTWKEQWHTFLEEFLEDHV